MIENDEGFFWDPDAIRLTRREVRESGVKREKVARVFAPPPVNSTWVAPREFPRLDTVREFAFDTETYDPDLLTRGSGLLVGNGHLVGVSLATDDASWYFPLRHEYMPEQNMPIEPTVAWLRDVFANERQHKVGANVLYDLQSLHSEGIDVRGPLYDVQYAEPLLDEYAFSYSLDALAQKYLKSSKVTSELYAWSVKAYGGKDDDQRANIYRCPASLVGPYAEADASIPLAILREQMKALRTFELVPTFKLECALIRVLFDMKVRGVRVDLDRAQRLDDTLTESINTKTEALGIDVYAAADIARYCDKHGIEYPRTEKGAPSFRKSWLEEHADKRLQEVSKLRRLLKLRDTFVRNSIVGHSVNGRVRCDFHPLRSDTYGTVSGRFSSANPNLQQVPARDPEWAPLVRGLFLPEDGCRWAKFDLSQIEYRLGVHFGVGTGIEDVRQRYRDDPKTDFYMVAAGYTGLPRQQAKAISLGVLYGMGPSKFAQTSNMEEHEARRIFAQYNENLPFMRDTYTKYYAQAESHGEVRTIGGRLCRLQKGWEHKALNRKLQGSCADLMKKAMVDAYEAGVFAVLPLHLTVHDELDVSVPDGCERELKTLRECMQNAYPLNIPVLADLELGPNWGELEDA